MVSHTLLMYILCEADRWFLNLKKDLNKMNDKTRLLLHQAELLIAPKKKPEAKGKKKHKAKIIRYEADPRGRTWY